MATFLTPDKIVTANVGSEVITIKQKIIPDIARATKDVAAHVKKGQPMKPCAKIGSDGKPRGICVHNTPMITPANGTNAAEQYCRATWPNYNMSGVVVHYYLWKSEIWQLLAETESGWHAADGASRRSSQRAGQSIGGNLDCIAIEVIQSVGDTETEVTTAKLVAHLLDKHGLSPDTDIYTHQYFYSKKACPAVLLPKWGAFKEQCKKYFTAIKGTPTAPVTPTVPSGKLYRVQIGAFSVKANADAMLAKAKAAGFSDAFVKLD